MMRLQKSEYDCCGCSACENICAHTAITMIPDGLGFKYPKIDDSKCIDCGLCEKVCSFNINYDISQNLSVPLVYAARHIKNEEVRTSQSGAATIAFSDKVLEEGGIVYGVGYDKHFMAVHKRVVSKECCNEFKGSKYIQSDLTGVFKLVKADLKAGNKVLFTGTPCQTSGLKSYIGNKFSDNLTLMDIVCHGVPSPYIWNDYIKHIEKKEKGKVLSVYFRDKEKGWATHYESFVINGRKIFSHLFRDLFYAHYIIRHSCGNCPYANLHRPSDVTVADFWGFHSKVSPTKFADDKGISLILINTNKGKKFFDSIKENLDHLQCKIDDCLQPNLQHSTKLHPKRDLFEKEYVRKGFLYVAKKYGTLGWRYKAKQLLFTAKGLTKKIIKIIVKKR